MVSAKGTIISVYKENLHMHFDFLYRKSQDGVTILWKKPQS